jgi:site-specific DNA-methyltransferase (adenine-specific)
MYENEIKTSYEDQRETAMKAERNKTIDMTLEEGQKYLKRCRDLRDTEDTGILRAVNKTIIGDNLKVLPLLKKRSVDLLIADPPYNINKDFTGNRFKKISPGLYREYTREWLAATLPLLKDTASVYVCCDWESSAVIAEVLGEYLHIRNRITWQREKGRGALRNWKNGMEDIWFATVSDKYTFNLDAVKIRRRVMAPYKENGKPKDWEESGNGRYRDTCPSNFWDDISVPYWSMPENTAHPTQKPEKLIAKLILASSNEGDVVLDPFLGAGTTSVTAKKLNRKYIGIEQNPQYCVWAEKRLEMADEDPSVQGFSDGVFWERNTAAEQKRKNRNS